MLQSERVLEDMEFFVDTNFFIQCFDISQINWSLVTDEENIDIIIARPVQVEIDKFKNDGNNRRSKKARKANVMFREILKSSDLFLRKNYKNKILTLKFAKNYRINDLSEQFKELDLSRPDDELIGTLINYNQLNGKNACLLTHDTNPVLTCIKNDIPFKFIPDEWILPPANDDKDKQINKLKKDIENLKQKEPIIDIKFNFINEINGLITISDYEGITDKKKNQILDSEKRKNPKKIKFNKEMNYPREVEYKKGSILDVLNLKKEFIPPTEKEIEQYYDEYTTWLEDIKKELENYSTFKKMRHRTIGFSLNLYNIGSKPIENLKLKFEVFNGVQLVPPNIQMAEKKSLNIPKGPVSPSGKWKTIQSEFYEMAKYLNNLNDFSINPIITPYNNFAYKNTDNNRNTFHWLDGEPKKFEPEWIFTCDEYRHKEEVEIFNYSIFLPKVNVEKFSMKVSVSGSNLIEPFVAIYKVNIKYVKERIDDD